MEHVKEYQVKTKTVTALKTYPGMPLSYIRDFMIGCKNIHLDLCNIHEGFRESIKGQGSPDLSPGDYIVMSENRNAAFMSAEDFENHYEERVDLTELHYVIQKYGFPVQDAEYMLRNEKLRGILLAPLHLHNKTSKRTQTTNHISINAQAGVDIKELTRRINEQASRELKVKNLLQ